MEKLQTNTTMIEIIQYSFLFTSVFALLIILQLGWATYQLQNHPCIEPIHDAKPEVADYLKTMLKQLSQLANISVPAIYVYRAALPNAFIIASIFKSDLYLSDELLESCDEKGDPLAYLTFVLCHEIAHIKQDDAIRLGFLTYANQCSSLLKLNRTTQHIQNKIQSIEQQADKLAHKLMQQHMKNIHPASSSLEQ